MHENIIYNEKHNTEQQVIQQHYRTNLITGMIGECFTILNTMSNIYSLATYLTAYHAGENTHNMSQTLFLKTYQGTADSISQESLFHSAMS